MNQSTSSKLKNYSVGGKKRDIVLLTSKIKFISKMRNGQKLETHNLKLVDDTWFTSFSRTINEMWYQQNKESRNKTLEFIKELYLEAIDCVESLAKEEDDFYKKIGAMLIENMKLGLSDEDGSSSERKGVTSLLNTYSNDKMFVSEVEIFLNVTKTKISYLEKLFVEDLSFPK